MQCEPARLARDPLVNELARFVLPAGIELAKRARGQSAAPMAVSYTPFVLTDAAGERLFCFSTKFFERVTLRAGVAGTADTLRRRRTSDGAHKRVAVARFDFVASKPSEISFAKGDTIVLRSTLRNDWWLGRRAVEFDCFQLFSFFFGFALFYKFIFVTYLFFFVF